MKINVNNYVGVLYESLSGIDAKEIGIVIENFVKLLNKNNHLRYTQRIISGFEELYNKKNNIIKAEAVSKYKLNDDVLKNIKKYFSDQFDGKKIELQNQVDDKMLGGVVLKTDDLMIDISLDSKLLKMKNSLIS